MAWWREARFGLFIHWGLYAIPGRGEWVQWNEQIPVEEYAKLANQFNPTNFESAAQLVCDLDKIRRKLIIVAVREEAYGEPKLLRGTYCCGFMLREFGFGR